MPVKAIYTKEDELRLAVFALRELANLQINAANAIESHPVPKATGKKERVQMVNIEALRESALQAAQNYLKAAEGLQWAIDGCHDVPTADEEKEELRKVTDELWEGIGYRYGGRLAETVRRGIEIVKGREKQAYGTVATIIDEQKIRLEALRWVLQQALDCSTHKSKDSSLYLGLRSIDRIVDELQKIDKDNPAKYSTLDWHVGSLNMRKLNAEIREKDFRIRDMGERINELEGMLKLKVDQATAVSGEEN